MFRGPTAGREQQTRLDVQTLLGEALGHVVVPGTMPGWELACRIHATFPAPAGSFWNIVVGAEALADTILTFAEAPMCTCVANKPSEDGKQEVADDALQLIGNGH